MLNKLDRAVPKSINNDQFWIHIYFDGGPTPPKGKGVKFKWGKEQQIAFDNIKKIIAKEVLLLYTDFNKPFHIYTDASKYQLGAVITKNEKPIVFYSRKLTDSQTKYETRDRELLSIIEVLREYRYLLLGHKVESYLQ